MSEQNTLSVEAKSMASIMGQVHKTSAKSFNNQSSLRMSLKDYLGRISEYSECHEGCFVLAMILIDRVLEKHLSSPKPLPFNIFT